MKFKIRKVVITAFLLGGLGWAAPLSAQSDSAESVAWWQSKFTAAQSDLWTASFNRSKSGDSWDLYELAAAVDAYCAMYRATGDIQYLDKDLTLINNVIATAVKTPESSQYYPKDSYWTWVVNPDDPKSDKQECPLSESYLWRYVTQLLRVMKENVWGTNMGQMLNGKSYQKHYDKILNFSRVSIFQKWQSRGDLNTIYRSRTHMSAHWAFIAMNLHYCAPENTDYLKYMNTIDHGVIPTYNSSLRSQMRNEGDNFVWNSTWDYLIKDGENRGKYDFTKNFNGRQNPDRYLCTNENDPPDEIVSVQDVSHGNGVISYIVESYGLNSNWINEGVDVNWTKDDIDRFVNTLNNRIWTTSPAFPVGDNSDKTRYGLVDGNSLQWTNVKEGNVTYWSSPTVIVGNSANFFFEPRDGYIKLGRYNPGLQRRFYDTCASGALVNACDLAQGALNARYLLNLR